jgi:serine/threonine protein kinase
MHIRLDSVNSSRHSSESRANPAGARSTVPVAHVVLKMPNLFFGSLSSGGSMATAADALLKSGQASPQQAVNQPTFTPIQAAKVKQFLQQYSIAKALQEKRVQGLVELHELMQVPLPHMQDARLPILVLDYFDGAMLGSHYWNPRFEMGFELEEFFHIAGQLAHILAAIHDCSFIHRDLTSSNILYQARTRIVRVIDFGISTPFFAHNNQVAHVTKQLQGTLHFLSPEQTGRIGRIVDWRTDIYSLGCVMYQVSAQHLE